MLGDLAAMLILPEDIFNDSCRERLFMKRAVQSNLTRLEKHLYVILKTVKKGFKGAFISPRNNSILPISFH
jgi:hypothetical protein